MSEIQSIAQNNYILHNIDAKKLYVQEPLFTANSGDAVYVGWRPDETVLYSGTYLQVSGSPSFIVSEPPTNFEYIEFYGKGYPGHQEKLISKWCTLDITENYINCVVDGIGSNGAALRFNQFCISANNTTTMSIAWAKQFSLQGSTASTANSPALLTKVIGVNRISGGNS